MLAGHGWLAYVSCGVPRDVTLAIETSNPSGVAEQSVAKPGVALLRAGEVLGVEAIATGNAQHDDLMRAIDSLCRRCGVTPREIARVVVSMGPGGFTNVRIAVTCARMIAEVTGAQLVGVPTAMVVAAGTARANGACAVALASKGETAHVTVIDASGAMVSAGVMDAGQFAKLAIVTVIADSHLPSAMREVAASKGWVIVHPVFDAVACARVSEGLDAIEPARLTPIYPREPEAVTKWRAMHAGKKS